MASNIQERLHWITHLPPRPEPDSENERRLGGVKDVQSEKDFISITSSYPEIPEVVRGVRGFVAWNFSGDIPQARAPLRYVGKIPIHK